MSYVVTVTAFRETLMHRLGMRHTMTIRALRHSLVLGGVTGRTGDLAVFGLAGREGFKGRIMTGCTK